MKQTAVVMTAWLAGAIETGGPYDPAATFVGVATAVSDQGQATTLADVTEALGDAADRLAITAWSAPYPLTDGRWAVDGPVTAFALSGADVNQVITHWFTASLVAAGVLKSWAIVEPPVELVADGSPLSIVMRLTIDPDGRFDASVMWDG